MNPPSVLLLRIDRAGERTVTHPRHRHPALDLKYVEAGIISRSGARVIFLDQWTGADATALTTALAASPRLAVIKAMSWCLDEAVAIGRRLRAAGLLTIAVGQQAAHLSRAGFDGWEQAFDVVVNGDPEAAVPEVVAAILAAADPQPVLTHYRRLFAAGHRFVVDKPDELPPPRHSPQDLLDFPFPFPLRVGAPRRWAYVLGSWGCPRACLHCSEVVRKSTGSGLEKRRPERVADEVERLVGQGAEAVLFEDDSLLVDKRHFLALCDEFARRRLKVPWLANARPDELDAERVDAAAAVGAALLKVGVDSGAPRIIERIGKTRDGEAWMRDTEAGFARLNQRGVGSVALFMVGLPGEGLAEIEASRQLAQRIEPDYVQVQIYCPYPDVGLWPQLGAAQRSAGGQYHYALPLVSVSALDARELPALQSDFYRGFYLRPGYVARHIARCWRAYLSPTRTADVAKALSFVVGGRKN